MSEFPVFPLFVSDYLADTWELNGTEHGAYLLILIHYWKQRIGPKTDTGTLKKVTRLDAKVWKRTAPKVMPFFEVRDGRIYHRRIEKELAIAGEKHKKRVEAGRRGAQAKLSNATSNATSNAQAMHVAKGVANAKHPELYPELLIPPNPHDVGEPDFEEKPKPKNSRAHKTNPRAITGQQKYEAQKRKELERKIQQQVDDAWDEAHRPTREEFLAGVRQAKAVVSGRQEMEDDW